MSFMKGLPYFLPKELRKNKLSIFHLIITAHCVATQSQ